MSEMRKITENTDLKHRTQYSSFRNGEWNLWKYKLTTRLSSSESPNRLAEGLVEVPGCGLGGVISALPKPVISLRTNNFKTPQTDLETNNYLSNLGSHGIYSP